ncbi:nucleotidyltransferase family protein [Clostridium lacusfryxellense]|uniref:nucleotidyltransferase family protein n=1 Tax=Clostridium lacusfryxellense TaxID=205328 RepID=UPI001C0C39FC|nr:nucleotidyltransferase family protein [Clostridium lacusfryxellense]MBU3113441.1 nucleotidyltransferase family protein [Clostridium lacusfryxellense]
MAVDAVVLAAGLSSRVGTYKMALDIHGKSVIERCIEGMYDICENIIVVGGYKLENITTILAKYEKVHVVFNKDYELGMFSSVKEGIRHVKEEKFFFTPGDYPLVSIEVYETLLRASGEIIIPTYGDRNGHPILINSNYISGILEENIYSNLREFIVSKEVTKVEVNSNSILMDIDTIEDYEEILKSDIVEV